MADTSALEARVAEFIQSKENSLWTAEERLTALNRARTAPLPTVSEDEWRKTDPSGFPWGELEAVEVGKTCGHVDFNQDCDAFRRVPADDRMKDLCLIAGDDYDAKFLYYHKALSTYPLCFRVTADTEICGSELVQRAAGPGLATFTTVVIVERGAHATLYDRWEAGDEVSCAIGRTEILVEEGAHLTYIQEDPQSKSCALYRRGRVQLERNARLNWYSATPGSRWHVSRLQMNMNGPGAEGNFAGLFAGNGSVRSDHRTHQYHASPDARSNLLFKALLAAGSHSVYQGIISVPHEAQKTDAYQTCRNLLLDPDTHAEAIPKLEIIADDVRCSHGASVGSLNEEQLFYLMSRGLSRRTAMSAIAGGFAEEVIDAVPMECVKLRWRKLVAETIARTRYVDE